MEGMTASMQLFTSNAGSIMMGNEAILRDIPPGTAIELKQTVNRILDEIRSENPSDFLAPLNIITSNSDEQSWKAAQVHLAIDSRQDSDLDDRPDLLDPWISKLAEKGYNVGWAEAPVGRDKRNRVDVRGMPAEMDRLDKAQKVSNHLKAIGWMVLSAFAIDGKSAVHVVLYTEKDATEKVKNPDLPPLTMGTETYHLKVTATRQYSILAPGQLSITGVERLEVGNVKHIQGFLLGKIDELKRGEQIRSSRVERDALHFVVDDWELIAALKSEQFQKQVSDINPYWKLKGPDLTFIVNLQGGWIKTVVSEIQDARRDIDARIDNAIVQVKSHLRDELATIKAENAVRDLRLANVENNQTEIVSNIRTLSHAVNKLIVVGSIGDQIAALMEQRTLVDKKINTVNGKIQKSKGKEKRDLETEKTGLEDRYTKLDDEIDELKAGKRHEKEKVDDEMDGIQAQRIQAPSAEIEELDELADDLIAIDPPRIPSPTLTEPDLPISDRLTSDNQSRLIPTNPTYTSITSARSQGSSTSSLRQPTESITKLVSNPYDKSTRPTLDRLQKAKEDFAAIETFRHDQKGQNDEVDMESVSNYSSGFQTKEPYSPDAMPVMPESHDHKPMKQAVGTARRTRAESRSEGSGVVRWLLPILLVLMCITPAMSYIFPSECLTVYGLNANGMGNALKLEEISGKITSRSPHVFVIGETKTQQKVAGRLANRIKGYKIYENTGEARKKYGAKWGVVMGIRDSIPLKEAPLKVPSILAGRVVAVDMILPTHSGGGIPHRMIGIYAPCRIEDSGETMGFWQGVAELCNSAEGGWTIAGDANATISSKERSSPEGANRRVFIDFLLKVNGVDLWESVPHRSYLEDYTCRPKKEGSVGGSIVDRVITSKRCVLDGEICVLRDDYIPNTDHRAIWASVVPAMSGSRERASYKPIERYRPPARLRYPAKTEKELFVKFRDTAEREVVDKGLDLLDISDDESFLDAYKGIMKICTEEAKKIFGVNKHRKRDLVKTVRNPKIINILYRIRTLGGVIRLLKSPECTQGSEETFEELQIWLEVPEEEGGKSRVEMVKDRRKAEYKVLYKERLKAAWDKVKRYDSARMINVLKGGSAKRLTLDTEFVEMPLALNPLKDPHGIEPDMSKIVTGAEQVKSITSQYFENLYKAPQERLVEKPWMETKSVKKIRAEIQKDPFVWPRHIEIEEYRSVLRRGNQRPAPGPDQCEKWVVKSMGDKALSVILKLVNYIIAHNRFPGDIKATMLLYLYKKGLMTALINWRGIMMSNFIAQSPMAILNIGLTPYMSRKGIVPPTQMACQKGAQSRDLISFLSQVRCYAKRSRQTIYVIKRDQMKGFDFLSPLGFHDAIKAYGLPHNIAELDKAAIDDNRCIPRTAYGLADSFRVSGLTKQGSILSPTKSVMTTGMFHRWIDDEMEEEDGKLVVRSAMREKRKSHYPDDREEFTILMAEMMDDSLIFGTTPEFIQKATGLAERIQFVYGWMTSWGKSKCYVLNADEHTPTHILFPSISPKNTTDPFALTEHRLEVERQGFEFCRATIDDADYRYKEITDLVERFRFATFGRRPGLPMIRKQVKSMLIAKIRPLIAMIPLKRDQAQAIDTAIARRIHNMMSFPYQFNSKILTHPIELGGLDFPSVERMNNAIAIEGMRRDLCHHIGIYRKMARITLADWTCSFNNCISPIEGKGLKESHTHKGSIPMAWITAQRALRASKIELKSVDKSYYREGDVSIQHVMNILRESRQDEKTRGMSQSIKCQGIIKLSDVGEWVEDEIQVRFNPRADSPFKRRATLKAREHWQSLKAIASEWKLHDIAQGPRELTKTRERRKREMEEWVKAVAAIGVKEPLGLKENEKICWGSDGSMKPAAAKWNEQRVVTAAVVGEKAISVKLLGTVPNVTHGEVTALVLASVLMERGKEHRLYTDHLNSKRLIDELKNLPDPEARLRNTPIRALYRWLWENIKDRTDIEILYTPSHTGGDSIAPKTNEAADKRATKAHTDPSTPQIASPTFTMDDYTIYNQKVGWIEGDIARTVENILVDSTDKDLTRKSYRLATDLYDRNPHPSYPYTHAVSAYSAAVQLYARSGQLPTRATMFNRGYTESNKCRFKCNEAETPHHLFAKCEKYDRWRNEAGEKLERVLREKLDKAPDKGNLEGFWGKAKFYFKDNDYWPLHITQYYLGHVPKIDKNRIASIEVKQLQSVLHNEMHYAGIRLAARIYGDYVKIAAREKEESEGRRTEAD